MIKSKNKAQVKWKGNSWAVGYFSIISHKRNHHSRTLKTYQNKLSKLKSRYNKLRCHSQISQKHLFIDKYPTFEKFLNKISLKQVNLKND